MKILRAKADTKSKIADGTANVSDRIRNAILESSVLA